MPAARQAELKGKGLPVLLANASGDIAQLVVQFKHFVVVRARDDAGAGDVSAAQDPCGQEDQGGFKLAAEPAGVRD